MLSDNFALGWAAQELNNRTLVGGQDKRTGATLSDLFVFSMTYPAPTSFLGALYQVNIEHDKVNYGATVFHS